MAIPWEEEDVFRMTMDTLLEDVEGVGGITLKVFERAGLRKISDTYGRNGAAEDAVRAAALAMAREQGTEATGHWRALATRCVTIINRIRHMEATPFCPEHFLCPITHVCMEDPVMTVYGDSYERWAIERAVDEDRGGLDPLSRRPLTRRDLFPNRALREAIRYYNAHFLRFSVPFRVPQRGGGIGT